jgi:hypothetical protein
MNDVMQIEKNCPPPPGQAKCVLLPSFLKSHKHKCVNRPSCPYVILSPENFSVKVRKLGIYQFFHKKLKIILKVFWLGQLIISENVLQNSFIWTHFQKSISTFRNLKICSDFRLFFWVFWLVGLSRGVSPLSVLHNLLTFSSMFRKWYKRSFNIIRLVRVGVQKFWEEKSH